MTARSQPPSDHQQGPVPLRPLPPRPLYTLWWWWAGIGVLVVLAGVVSGELYLQAYGYGLWTRRPSVNAPTQPAIAAPSRALEPVPAGGQGQGLRDGEVEFTVTAVDCSQSELGLYTKARAQGYYCLLNVQATNLGTVPVSLPTEQTAYSSDGLWLFPDHLAQTYLSGSSLYSTPLEPSSTASGPLVFDVPTSTTLKSVRLKARTGSNGVVVKLG